MSLFKELKVDPTVELSKDSLGGGSKYGPLESGIYEMVIDMAYADAAKSGAQNVNFVFKDATGREYKETIYVTSRTGSPTYVNKKTGKSAYLPGYNTVLDISLLTIGEELDALGEQAEEKVINIYSYELKKDVPTPKQVLMPLLGQKVKLGIVKVIEDKNVKNAQGMYVPSGETRTINQIDKVFRASDDMTTSEIRNKAIEAEFHKNWAERNNGKVINKAKGTAAEVETPAPAKKLFG